MKSKIENCLYLQVAHCNKCGGESGYNIYDGIAYQPIDDIQDFIATEISKAREETLKEVLDYSKGFDYEFEACRATEKYLETELDKLKDNK
jgi:hypothetical protein